MSNTIRDKALKMIPNMPELEQMAFELGYKTAITDTIEKEVKDAKEALDKKRS